MLLLLLLQEAGGFKLLQEVAELGAKQPAHGVAKLMEWLASGEGYDSGVGGV
jgi:hypothetical protein